MNCPTLHRSSNREPIGTVLARPSWEASACPFGLTRRTPSPPWLSPSAQPRRTARRARDARDRSALYRREEPGASLAASATWRAAYERGQKAWSHIPITFEEFSAHGEALGHREAPAHATDLYLTAACRLGRYAAVRVLDEQYIVRSKALIHGMVRNATVVNDLLQDVRRRLLVGPAAKVCSYRGRGPLGSWIRSIALNVARDHIRTEAARRRAEEAQALALACAAGSSPLSTDEPARCILRRNGVQACSDMVREGFLSLPNHERQLLFDHYIRGLSIDVLAPLCNVNRATVARRIRRSTDELRRQLRKRLSTLYPREDAHSLDALALAACRDLMVSTEALLEVSSSGSDDGGCLQSA